MKYESKIGSGFQRWTEGVYTPGQRVAALDFQSSFILLSGSYRSGKSEMGARLALRHALTFQNAKVGIFRQHLASLKKSTLLTLLELTSPDWVANWSNTELVLELVNGSRISFLGCEFADRIGSLELTYGFIDEAHEVSPESLGMIQGRLSGKLGGYTGGYFSPGWEAYYRACKDKRQLLLACNPKSTNHHLYRDFVDPESRKPGYQSFSSNSISNGNLPVDYLVNNLSAYTLPGCSQEWILSEVAAVRAGERDASGLHLKDRLTQFGQRNLLGLWVSMEGQIYQSYDPARHFVSQVPTEWGSPTGLAYGAVDWGFNNPRIIVAKEYPEGRLALVDYWAEAGQEPGVMIEAMRRLQEQHGVKFWFLPPDQPGLIKSAKRVLGTSRIRKAKNAVLAGIDLVSQSFSKGKLCLLDNGSDAAKLADRELQAYEWSYDRQTSAYKDAPVKLDDHFPDAIRYLVATYLIRGHKVGGLITGDSEKP